jgi:hypothetical protein
MCAAVSDATATRPGGAVLRAAAPPETSRVTLQVQSRLAAC